MKINEFYSQQTTKYQNISTPVRGDASSGSALKAPLTLRSPIGASRRVEPYEHKFFRSHPSTELRANGIRSKLRGIKPAGIKLASFAIASLFFSSHISAYIFHIRHFIHPETKQHLFLCGDYHVGPHNKPQDRDIILNAAKQMNATIIVEDMIVKIFPILDNSQDPLSYNHKLERPILAKLLANSTGFDPNTLELPDFPNVIGPELEGEISQHYLTSCQIKLTDEQYHAFKFQSPMLCLSLLCRQSGIPVINAEWRMPLVASISGYPISSADAFRTIEQVVAAVRQFNDGAILNQYYAEILSHYEKSCKKNEQILNKLKASDQPLSIALKELPYTEKNQLNQTFFGAHRPYLKYCVFEKKYQKCHVPDLPAATEGSDWQNVFYTNMLNNDLLQNHFLTDLNLLHYIHQQQAPTLFVLAGAIHQEAICPILKKIGYQQVDEYKTEYDFIFPIRPPKVIDLGYYFSHFTNGLHLLTPEDVWTVDRDVPILLSDNVNFRDKNGKTALIHAAERNLTAIVNYLIQQPGLDITIVDNAGNKALDYAKDRVIRKSIKSIRFLKYH